MLKGSSALARKCLVQRCAALTRVDPAHAPYRILSTSALPNSDAHNHDHEGEKKAVEVKGVSDANQPSKSEWQQTKDSVADVGGRAKNKVNEVKGSTSENAEEKAGQAKSVMGKVSEQAKKEVNTSADMMKDMPQKVSETTQELKEVGIEAGKAVKRDANRVAEKAGLKSSS